MIKTGIIGGAGYAAGELLRILINHPKVEIGSVISRSHAGEKLYKAHPDLEGEIDQKFSEELSSDMDVVFICSGHGKSKEVVESEVISANTRIIDLSSDYRLKSKNNAFVYGLPELNKDAIKPAGKIANPGCFATSIELALLPLAKEHLLKNEIHVSAITGSTGAGQNPTETTHFSWRNNNASVYNPFTHRHLGEIKESLTQLQSNFDKKIHFLPMRGAFSRGILSAVYTNIEKSETEIRQLYEDYYENHPFVQITENSPDVKRVVNTNKALLHIQKVENQLLITSVIDNLLKGASGQAVQNMNLIFGLDETTGLTLKPTAF